MHRLILIQISSAFYPLQLLTSTFPDIPRIRRPTLRMRSKEDCLPIFFVLPPLDAPEVELAEGEGAGACPPFVASGRSLRQVGRRCRREDDAADELPCSLY